MPTTTANGINIYYEIHGSGDPLVLICGLGYDMWQWHKMVPGLAEQFQVITFDNRGVGQTDKPAGPYSAALLAADTAALLEALNIEKAHIMGHSMGGFIAQEMALSYPEMVDKLILASTNFGGPHHLPITPEAMAVLSDMTSDPVTRFKNGLAVSTAPGWSENNAAMIEEWLAWRVANPVDPAPYQAQMAIGLSLLAEDACFEPRLANVHAETLILFGEHDKVVPPGNADLLAAKIPSSTIHLLPNAGHFFPIEVPEAANEAIIEFLKS
ncbi:MAG: alpha/beta hydrolase [Ardenticatenaceae bacterium]|nr:alpha/beta hydrolase [Ardenticatenaceae bacterium]MCB9444404.1 alpha/beta hydrolase [Ardenticatenaceae bacterium]